MTKIKVTNTTSKKETSKDLELSSVLSAVRKQLGSSMNKGDAFLGKDGKPVALELETTTKLESIEYTGALKTPGVKISARAKDVPTPEPVIDDDVPIPEAIEGSDKEDGAVPIEDPEQTEGELLNVEPFQEGPLTPIELPEYEWAEDHVGLETGLVDGQPVKGDKLTNMKVGQVRRLLKANRIDLNKQRYGITAAFVDTGDLARARYDAVHCAEVEVKTPDADRITNISFQYDEHVSRLHRTTTNEGDADVGIPGIFKLQGSYRNATATRSDTRVVEKHMSSCHMIPKARVVFKDDKIALSEEFVQKIRQAVAGSEARASAEKLLDVLEAYGQFIASDMLLGGRLNHWTSTKLQDSHHASEAQSTFRIAARARASFDGFQGEAGGAWGNGLTEQEKTTVVHQAHALHFKLMGGNEATVSSDKWIPTVAKYLNWKVIGFNPRSLVPIIDYLQQADLRARCINLLKTYFTSNLQFRTTEITGLTHAKQFGYDIADAKRIVKIEVNHGINIDGLKITYELANGQHKEMPWLGERRGEHNSTVGPLDFDEEITSIEVGARTFLRRLAFNTTKRRFPESTNEYYGRGERDEVLTYSTIEAPRVCGVVGHVGTIIDSIGLRYRELSSDRNVKSRHFLLDIEPHLFPLNVPSTIEMTIRGVLLAGRWRTEEDLNRTSADNKRNTLITELGVHSNEGGGYIQGLGDDALVGKAAIVLFLIDAGGFDNAWLKANSFASHRNALIDRIHSYTDEPLDGLRKLSDQELVRWGSTIKSNAVTATAARV